MKLLPTNLLRINLLLLGFLVACVPVMQQTLTPTNEIKASSTIEPVPTASETPTSVPTPDLKVLELTSATDLPLPVYKRDCVNILRPSVDGVKKNLRDLSLNGTAVFSDYVGGKNGKDVIILFNLKTGNKRTLPTNLNFAMWANEPEVSPDRKWLFYKMAKGDENIDKANFVLSKSDGVIIKTIPGSIVGKSGYSYITVHQWLGNNSLRLLNMNNSLDDYLIVLLLNPFTGKITKLRTDFDGLQPPVIKYAKSYLENHQFLDWGIDPFLDVVFGQLYGANVAYNPEANLAFYPHSERYDVLYDVTNSKELARLIIPDWGELPRWSPAGKYISIIATPPNSLPDSAKKDFYLLSNNGKEFTRLTYLSEQFERVSIKEYAWSPDGTKIAFWLNTNFPSSNDERTSYELSIVDIKNGNVTNYCIENPSGTAEQLRSSAGFQFDPVWSPDSKELLVEIETSEIPITETVLINPSKLSALTITRETRLHGWMINEP